MSAQSVSTGRAPYTVDEVVTFLVAAVCDLIGLTPTDIDPSAPIDSLALDSLEAVILTGDLSTWLGWEVDETLPWKVETLGELAEVVATEDAIRQAS